MDLDISHILKDWPYDHSQISARKIRGDDGREKIQLRLDLGLLQMEVTGRPDGQRPHDYPSLLDYYEHARDEHDKTAPTGEPFELDEQACECLRNEGVMYYHRYLAEFIMEDYEAVMRDSARNLRLIEFCSAYAHEESDRYVLEQHRPYVVMMRTRASALLALGEHRPKSALSAVRQGIEELEEFHRRYGQEAQAGRSGELTILRALAREIQRQIPVDPAKRIRQKLEAAVEEERYEEAAELRDQLRRLAGGHFPGGRL